MSMPASPRRVWNLDAIEELIDKRDGLAPRLELVNGNLLVTPAPTGRHQRIVFRLSVLLDAYVRRHRLGEVRLGPAEVRLSPDTRCEPDLFVVPAVSGKLPRANDPVTRLLLAVEVVSAGSARHDRITKRRFFQTHGVPEYWVVDGESETFEIWRPEDERPALIDDRIVWHPEAATVPLELDLRSFFADIADDVA
ncbi:MAG TPA: Uma2 family endonuclease [Gemmatimonadaceae bacterium]